MIDTAEGVLIGFSDGQEVTYVTGAGFLLPHVGTTVDLYGSGSGHALRTRRITRSDDTEHDPDVDRGTCRRLGVASAVWVPLCRGDVALGVLAVGASRPYAFSDDDVDLLARLADFMSIAVGLAEDLARVGHDLLRVGQPPEAALDSGIGDTEPDHVGRFMVNVFRPDVDDAPGAPAAHRTGARAPGTADHAVPADRPRRPPARSSAWRPWPGSPRRPPALQTCGSRTHTAAAWESNSENLAVAKALDQLDAVPEDWFLTCNVGPATLGSPTFADLLSGADPTRRRAGAHRARRGGRLRRSDEDAARATGVGARLAIDDTGAGFSSLSHVLRLAPDFIKLDRELVSGIDFDPVRRVLTSSLVDFAAGTGTEIVAEGVELEDELRTLELLGVRYAQGFFTGPAADLDSLVHTALGQAADLAARRRMGVGVGSGQRT